MDLPAVLSDHLGLPRARATILAAVVLGGIRVRAHRSLGDRWLDRLDRAVPELAPWTREAGMAADIDARRLARDAARPGRGVALIAEVLYGLGAEPALADLVPALFRAFLVTRLGEERVILLGQVVPFLAGAEATPTPTLRGAVGPLRPHEG